MSAPHTPGPWESVIDDKWIYVGSKGYANYRNAFAQVDYDDVDHEEAEANARLIAAAPALLEALEAIDKVVSGYKSQMKFCDIEALGYFREFVRRIEATKHAAALSLAKGESA